MKHGRGRPFHKILTSKMLRLRLGVQEINLVPLVTCFVVVVKPEHSPVASRIFGNSSVICSLASGVHGAYD